jgi:VIT1/CCC1 family predicted Fe2+/Mn2+ transporter
MPPAGAAPRASLAARDAQRAAHHQQHQHQLGRPSRGSSLGDPEAGGGSMSPPRRIAPRRATAGSLAAGTNDDAASTLTEPLPTTTHGDDDHGHEHAAAGANSNAQQNNNSDNEDDEHEHFSHRAPWLRAFVLGANDGLVSVASLMLGVGAADGDLRSMVVSGVAGLAAGSLSMACGEFISVSSQRDAEEADVEKERAEQAKGPEARARELEELAGIYMARGLSEPLAREVARELTEVDVIRAHARDELGIDLDDMANPLQASLASALAFTVGAGVPLLAGAFLQDRAARIGSVVAATTAMMLVTGALGASLGGAPIWKGALRVLVGGWIAMALTFGIGTAFGAAPA